MSVHPENHALHPPRYNEVAFHLQEEGLNSLHKCLRRVIINYCLHRFLSSSIVMNVDKGNRCLEEQLYIQCECSVELFKVFCDHLE